MTSIYVPYHDHVYGAQAQNILKKATYAAGGTISAEANTCYLIGDSATFITDGVEVGDLITLDAGGETATVLSVDSETELFTSILSDSGTYDSAEAFTITRDGVEVTTGTVAATDPMTYMVIDDTATFLADGVMKGDTVTMTIGGETATVVKVFSDTRLSTTTLSGAGTYDADEAFTIDDGDIYRAIVYVDNAHKHVIRQIIGVTDDTNGDLRIFADWNATADIFELTLPKSTIFVFNPDTGVKDGTPLIIEMDISTEALSNLNVSWEFR